MVLKKILEMVLMNNSLPIDSFSASHKYRLCNLIAKKNQKFT